MHLPEMTGTCHATLVDEVESIDLGDVPWEVTSPKVGSDGIGVKGSDLCVCEVRLCPKWTGIGQADPRFRIARAGQMAAHPRGIAVCPARHAVSSKYTCSPVSRMCWSLKLTLRQ